MRAWANGPVVADLWYDEKKKLPRPAPMSLDASSLGTVGFVTARYGGLTGKQLVGLTHAEHPWREVSERDDPGWSDTISPDAMRASFVADAELASVAALADAAMRDPEVAARLKAAVERSRSEPPVTDDPARLQARLRSLG